MTARGVCWGQSAHPTTAGGHTSDGTGTGSFTSEITGLDPNTTYYYRANASNLAGTAYGGDLTFKTDAFSDIAYVDGTDPTCSGQTPCFSTIQDAIDSPLAPETIMVAPGTYQEHVVLNNGRAVIIEGSGSQTKVQSPVVVNGSVVFRNLNVIP